MRLSDKERWIIKTTIASYIDDAVVYLFGSRVNEDKKGGDIDLFIISKTKSYDLKLKLKAKLKNLLQKPVDIVFHSDFSKDIEKVALKGVKL